MTVLQFQNPACDCMLATTERELSQKADNATHQQLEATRVCDTKRPCAQESIRESAQKMPSEQESIRESVENNWAEQESILSRSKSG